MGGTPPSTPASRAEARGRRAPPWPWVVVTALLVSAPAAAESTLSIGGYTGYYQSQRLPEGRPTGPVAGVTVRARVLDIFGMELGAVVADRSGRRYFEALSPKYRASFLLTVVPKDRTRVFLRFGTGALERADLFHLEGATTSYHLGAGALFQVIGPVWLDLGVLAHLPGVGPVRELVTEAEIVPKIRELVNMDNLEVDVGLRFEL